MFRKFKYTFTKCEYKCENVQKKMSPIIFKWFLFWKLKSYECLNFEMLIKKLASWATSFKSLRKVLIEKTFILSEEMEFLCFLLVFPCDDNVKRTKCQEYRIKKMLIMFYTIRSCYFFLWCYWHIKNCCYEKENKSTQQNKEEKKHF
jgi:hypothetical protein